MPLAPAPIRTQVRTGRDDAPLPAGHASPTHWALVDTCDGCGQVLAQAHGCPGIEDDWPTAVRWGQEHWWHDDDLEPPPRCPSCWTHLDQHHHLGCSRTRCELCQTHLDSCPHGAGDEEHEP